SLVNTVLFPFSSHEPIGFRAGDVNLYRFVGNDPVNEVDPSGLEVATRGAHFYPLYLGGCDAQPLFEANKELHTAAHDVLRRHGVGAEKGDAGRALWKSFGNEKQRSIVKEAMKAAQIPNEVIEANLDKIFANAQPGTNLTHTRKTPRV